MYLVSIRREGRLLVGRDFWQIILSNNRFLNKTLNWFAPPVFIISLLMQNGLWMQFQHVHPNTYIRSDYPTLLLTNGSIFTTLYLIFETLWIITPCSYPISWMFSFFNSIVRLLVCGLSILSIVNLNMVLKTFNIICIYITIHFLWPMCMIWHSLWPVKTFLKHKLKRALLDGIGWARKGHSTMQNQG